MLVINKLYKKWLIIQSIFHKFQLDYEFKNVMERFLLSNDWPQFTEEVRAFENSDKIIEGIKFMMNSFEKAPTPSFGHKIEIGDNFFKMGRYHRLVSPDRINVLRSFNEMETATMFMRYATILSTSQHWSVPTYVYKKIVENYKINIEGFASPINSQFLKMSRPFSYMDSKQKIHNSKAIIKKPQFCSIFAEDKPFGSLGSFFNNDFTGKRVLANPPFVLSLMNAMADHIISNLRSGKTLFIVNVPNWIDAEYYIKLKNSEFCKQHIEYEAFKHWYEENDNYILSTFPISYFVMSSHAGEKINVENLYDI